MPTNPARMEEPFRRLAPTVFGGRWRWLRRDVDVHAEWISQRAAGQSGSTCEITRRQT